MRTACEYDQRNVPLSHVREPGVHWEWWIAEWRGTEAKAQEYRWLEARFLLVLVTQRERVGAPAAMISRVPLPQAFLYSGTRVEREYR